MNFNRFQTAVLVCFHRERLSLDLLSLWSWKAQLSKQPLFAAVAPRLWRRTCRRAATTPLPSRATLWQPFLSAVSKTQRVCLPCSWKGSVQQTAFSLTANAPAALGSLLSVSAVSKTQRGCLVQPRIPSSESSIEIYFLESLLKRHKKLKKISQLAK